MNEDQDIHIEANSSPENTAKRTGRILAGQDPVGQIDDRMLAKRAFEIAEIEGRKGEPTTYDYDQARAELLGTDLAEVDEFEAIDDETARDPSIAMVPPYPRPEDAENDEQALARLETEQGIQEAEHDQMKEARKAEYDPRHNEEDRDL